VITRIAVLGLIVVTGLLIDTVVLADLAVAGVSPSVLLLSVAAVGLTDGGEAGARFGFSAGLATDLLSGGLLGVTALVYLLAGFGVGSLRPFIAGSALLTQVTVGAAVSVFAIGVYGGLTLLFDPQGVGGTAILLAAVGIGVANALLAPLVVRPVAAALRRVDVTLPA
jgi:rod shape-determining protein MreD